jgi:hypothetical protein
VGGLIRRFRDRRNSIRLLFSFRWQLANQRGRFELNTRQGLTQFIVDLTRHTRPFLFANTLQAGGQCAQFVERTLQGIFGPFTVFDFSTRSKPLDDVSYLVAQWHGANQEPAIFPVGPPQAHFIVEGFPSCQLREPPFP